MSDPTPKVEPTDVIAGALASLGPWGAIGGLALKFGVPFVSRLIENAANKKPVTPEEWTALKDKIATPWEDL